MKRKLLPFMLLGILLLFLCYRYAKNPKIDYETTRVNKDSTRLSPNSTFRFIHDIPLPGGYERMLLEKGGFANWLRYFPLKKDNLVRLYNGTPIANQHLHYAVLDITTGSKDLQQCADALMRLRAEYYFDKKAYTQIKFNPGSGAAFNFNNYAKGERYRMHGDQVLRYQTMIQQPDYSHTSLLRFMETVFTYCGTYTIEGMTHPVNINNLQVGDVFTKAGAPGHVMMVADAAVDTLNHEKIFLLVQGYMPAQDMHIVINPSDSKLSPWYRTNDKQNVITPGWTFTPQQLRRF